ncbi:predicted protein [Histoplasma mississippiense (nom. inval.)]|uniref:predicted protein n=1 Tax=Ajellomyces capsulatus (strain NAm1 / WU24) TaxID=2059318 RepID=UPI000157C011|nr:predicted protein [Histoplasma mississippiense (nom. inval.)]EDN07051.1 predicted protein [Histoplasma mississippiense (nom. inval.)]
MAGRLGLRGLVALMGFGVIDRHATHECNIEPGFLRTTPLIRPELKDHRKFTIEHTPGNERGKLALSKRMNTDWSWGRRIVDELGGPVSSSHDHCAPDIPSPPSAGNSSASGLPTSLTNQQNRGPGDRNTALGYKDARPNISEEPMQFSFEGREWGKGAARAKRFGKEARQQAVGGRKGGSGKGKGEERGEEGNNLRRWKLLRNKFETIETSCQNPLVPKGFNVCTVY